MKSFFKIIATFFLIYILGLSCYLFVVAFGPIEFFVNAKWQFLGAISSQKQIPEIIHYVWIGQEPQSVQQAIQTWQKFMPHYKIKKWDETNCPIEQSPLALKALKQQKYQWVSDFCRLYALNNEGGLYLDTDMYLKAPLDELLTEPLVLVGETTSTVSGGIFASAPHHPFISRLLDIYKNENPHTFLTPKVSNKIKVSQKEKQDILSQRAEQEDETFFPIPEMMTDVFNDMYAYPLINQLTHLKDVFVFYPASVLMLDFGGPENMAEHYYANGKADYLVRGRWYDLFAENFLNAGAFEIADDQTRRWFLPSFLSKAYFVEKKDSSRFYATEPLILYDYRYQNDLLTIYQPDGQEISYRCQAKRCIQQGE